MVNRTKVRRGAVFISRAKHGRDGLLKAVSFVTLVRTKKVETQQKCEAGGSPAISGRIPSVLYTVERVIGRMWVQPPPPRQ